MKDLVATLRDLVDDHASSGNPFTAQAIHDAAEEIERLRERVRELQGAIELYRLRKQ